MSEVADSPERYFPEPIKGLTIESGLKRINGNIRLYLDLLHEFLVENQGTLERVTHALSNQNPEYASSLIHTVKGTAGNIGAEEVYLSSKELETAIHAKNGHDQQLNRFDRAISEVLESINHYFKTYNHEENQIRETPTSDTAIDPDLSFKLSKLKQLLESNNFSAEAYLQTIVDHIPPDYRSMMIQLSSHVNRLEFNRATQELKSFAQGLGIHLE